jgi:uncharacterized protein YraI
MRTKLIIAVAAAAALFTGAAEAATGYTVNNFNMYAGPGREFPRIERVPNNARLEVHGCLRSYSWCDVSYRGERGWIDGNGLQFRERGRRIDLRNYGPRYQLPMVSFRFGDYWDSHYRTHRFYRDRSRFQNAFRDRDHDNIPNALDRDRDGDGVRNRDDRRPNNPDRR